MSKNVVIIVLLAIALIVTMSACTSNPITAGYNACGDITSCVNNTGPAMESTPCIFGTRGTDGNCY